MPARTAAALLLGAVVVQAVPVVRALGPAGAWAQVMFSDGPGIVVHRRGTDLYVPLDPWGRPVVPLAPPPGQPAMPATPAAPAVPSAPAAPPLPGSPGAQDSRGGGYEVVSPSEERPGSGTGYFVVPGSGASPAPAEALPGWRGPRPRQD